MPLPAPAASDTPDAWHALATPLSLRLAEDDYGVQAGAAQVGSGRMADGFLAPLPDLGLLNVSGADALRFLHGQLTNDVEGLAQGQARWFGYCTAKGRLLSVFLGWREDEAVALSVARPMAAALARRLSMYVLRAKARVADVSGERVLFGLGGRGAPAALERLGLAAPVPMEVVRAGAATVIALPPVQLAGGDCPRWLLALPAHEAAAAWQRLMAEDLGLAAVSSEAWRWTEILAGVPRLVAATAEQFVPQMLNLDLSGGVSFTKGCYPGQEIVARTHYLGKQRRRMHLGRVLGEAPAPGSDVLDAAGQPVGRVVVAAAAPDGGAALLYEAQLAAVAGGPLSVLGASGASGATGATAPTAATIEPGELPYALPS
ncbi:folate-binding protein YgfZ [Quisquiliibacterium transsilvanicum]